MPTDTGDLNHCAYCGRPLSVVDGSDPDMTTNSFWERYECPDGHTGRYEWDGGGAAITERFTGACGPKREVA